MLPQPREIVQPPPSAEPEEPSGPPGGAAMEDEAPGVGDELMEGSLEIEPGSDDVQEELDYLGPSLSAEQRETATQILRAVFALGASPVEAKALVTEIFSPPRVAQHAARFPSYGVLPGGAYDLRPGPDGRSWDFDKEEDRLECERRIDAAQPFLLIGCPPCTDWSIFNRNLNHCRMPP